MVCPVRAFEVMVWDCVYIWVLLVQLLLRGQTRYFAAGTIIADRREKANGMYVITSGQVLNARVFRVS